jgi:hypothetical protein
VGGAAGADRAQLRALAPAAVCEHAVADALACWDAVASGPLGARLRELAGCVVARELPLVLAEGIGFATGSIDLLYRDRDGRLVVVDYKTDRVTAETDRYARQGALYCRAVREALGADAAPRFEIWWLRSGTVEPIADR